MAFSPITSWQIEGGKLEAVIDFIFLGSKITVDSDCSYEIKMLAPWKESYGQPRQYIGEGNGTPLQYSCLENPRDRGVCWAAVYGVSQSRTRLMQLSSSSGRQYINKQRHHFAYKGSHSQRYGFVLHY